MSILARIRVPFGDGELNGQVPIVCFHPDFTPAEDNFFLADKPGTVSPDRTVITVTSLYQNEHSLGSRSLQGNEDYKIVRPGLDALDSSTLIVPIGYEDFKLLILEAARTGENLDLRPENIDNLKQQINDIKTQQEPVFSTSESFNRQSESTGGRNYDVFAEIERALPGSEGKQSIPVFTEIMSYTTGFSSQFKHRWTVSDSNQSVHEQGVIAQVGLTGELEWSTSSGPSNNRFYDTVGVFVQVPYQDFETVMDNARKTPATVLNLRDPMSLARLAAEIRDPAPPISFSLSGVGTPTDEKPEAAREFALRQ